MDAFYKQEWYGPSEISVLIAYGQKPPASLHICADTHKPSLFDSSLIASLIAEKD